MSNIDSNKQFGTYTMGQNHVLENIWLKYKSNAEGTWVTKMPTVIKLHEFLKELQPKHILELGTGIGCSTEIIAFTCPNTSIYTVEQNPKCIEIAKTMIPDVFKERIYFKLANTAVLKPIYEVNPFVYFMAYHTPYDWRDYDFIYVDGPGPFKTFANHPETKQSWEVFADLPCGDILMLLNRINEGTYVFIDKRHLTVHYLQRHCLHYLDLVEQTKDYTIFKRNSRLLKMDFVEFMNSDLTLQQAKEKNYLNPNIINE